MKPRRPSMRKAINDMCKGCIYDDLCPGTWRQQVEACTYVECPLWPLRPVSATAVQGETEEVRHD